MTDAIYTAADFNSNGEIFRTLNPPARLSVFGNPIAHSQSPKLQNAALKASKIDAQYVKILLQVDELQKALRALPLANFIGTNITIPYKASALKMVDEANDYAQKSGAINTVVVKNNRLIGFNTDGPGFLRAIREEFDADIQDLRILLLGTGGTGRAIAVQCVMEKCKQLTLVNRTFDKAKMLAEELAHHFPNGKITNIPHEEKSLRENLAHTDLVINATSVGMKKDEPSLLPAEMLTSNLMVYDTVYATGKSRLVAEAKSVGAKAANGLSMLLHQGALAFEIWFNRPAPLDVMRQILGHLKSN